MHLPFLLYSIFSSPPPQKRHAQFFMIMRTKLFKDGKDGNDPHNNHNPSNLCYYIGYSMSTNYSYICDK